MRTPIRRLASAAALWALGALVGLSGCQRQPAAPTESASTSPSNADREAEIAAEHLAALGGAATPAQRALYEGEFQASGAIADLGSAEGAWELGLLEDYAQLSRPGLGDDGGVAGERLYRERGMQVVAGALTITIMQQACTASGVELPYVAHVLFEGVAYQGCARRGIEAGDRPTWASALPDLIPAIDACLVRTGAASARVTFASALEDGEASVRIREADGSRSVCIANRDGAGARHEPLSDIDTASGEGNPEFLRGEAQPRARNCRAVEAVNGRAGEHLGWLIRRSC